MTNTVRPFVNESAEAFRQGRAREARLAPRRDDGALIQLARLIGETCAGSSTDSSVDAAPTKAEAPKLSPPVEKEPPATAQTTFKRTDSLRFAAGYRSVLQSVKVDWDFGREDSVEIDRLPDASPLGPAIDVACARADNDLLSYRSLPGAPPFSGEGFDTFDVGSRLDIAWPGRLSSLRGGIAIQHIKIAASVGMIAAAIAGFWGGSVIKSGHNASTATSSSDPKETSALQSMASPPIRVATTDTNPQSGSPFGTVPTAFIANGQSALARPLAATMAVAKSEITSAAAPGDAQSNSGQPIVSPISVASPPAPAPVAAKLPTEADIVATPPARPNARANSASAGIHDEGTSLSAKRTGHVTSHLTHQTGIARHGESQPSKKRNPLAIVRFNDKNALVGADPTGLATRPPAAVPQSQPVVAQPGGNDFFLTRFLDKIFRN